MEVAGHCNTSWYFIVLVFPEHRAEVSNLFQPFSECKPFVKRSALDIVTLCHTLGSAYGCETADD